MTQDEAYHCLLRMFEHMSTPRYMEMWMDAVYKTDIAHVLKSASPETVYGALHEWAREKE